MAAIAVPGVTLCAVTSVNVAATIDALKASLSQLNFGRCLLFTDAPLPWVPPQIQIIQIDPISSAADYSEFVLRKLVDFITTDHCLIVQWDGFVLAGTQWDDRFLEHDYIGAPWPQFRDSHDVGNGGFSLRSRKLLQACRDPRFQVTHPEDLAICRLNRDFLEREHGIRFADRHTAERFAFERTTPTGATFGFHGVFNLIPALGADHFWSVYRRLDHRGAAFLDYSTLMRQLGTGRRSTARRIRLSLDRLGKLAGR